jgi:hypothetical protein
MIEQLENDSSGVGLKIDPESNLLIDNARLKHVVKMQKERIARMQRLLGARLSFEKSK